MCIYAEISLRGLNLWWLVVCAMVLCTKGSIVGGVQPQTRPTVPLLAGDGSAVGA